jgi:hypothetical protein
MSTGNIKKKKVVRLIAGRSRVQDEVKFEIYLILPAALDPGVYSASNRNEYRKH